MKDPDSSLFLLFVVLSVLTLCIVSWCILSTCMGEGIIQGFRSLWDMSVVGAQSNSYTALPRQSRMRGDEAWEMDYRNSRIQ